jgi:aminodeoxyfutalosine synthase
MTTSESVLEKAIAGERLSQADCAAIHATSDVLSLGMAADEVRRRRHGSRMTFVRVADLELASLDPDTVTWPDGAGEVRLTGSLVDLPRVLDAVRRVAKAASGGVPVTGFSIADVEAIAAGDDAKAADILKALRDAGLECVAEAPLDVLREPQRILKIAEGTGIGIARATVDRASAEARQSLVDRAAAILRAHPSIVAFAPLARDVGAQPSTGFEDVRFIALTRLLVDVPHVQVDWRLYGPKLAQVALTFGADDIDSVSPIDEAPEGRRRAPLEEIRRNILAASGEPAERNGRFEMRR